MLIVENKTPCSLKTRKGSDRFEKSPVNNHNTEQILSKQRKMKSKVILHRKLKAFINTKKLRGMEVQSL